MVDMSSLGRGSVTRALENSIRKVGHAELFEKVDHLHHGSGESNHWHKASETVVTARQPKAVLPTRAL